MWKGKGTKANQNKSNTNTWRILQVSRPCGHRVRFGGAIKEAKDSFAHSSKLANRLISGTACVYLVAMCILYLVAEEQRFAQIVALLRLTDALRATC